MTALHVFLGDTEIGRLEEAQWGLRFTYGRAWLDAPDAFAISNSLPLRESPFDREATRFFGNLLPEGPARTSIVQKLGISEENDFALLRILGRDCPGALRVLPSITPPARLEKPRRVTDDDLQRWSYGMGLATTADRDLRLSVAGAQYKLGVVLDGDDLVIPGDESPSTHLLKLPNRDFAALPQNEAFVLALARAVGLEAVESRLHPGNGAPLLLVTRYDRIGVPVRRLHQEDLCQALGLDRRSKYESEHGASFKQCFDTVRRISRRALIDQRALLRWLAFCAVVGNRDNHAKNLSVLRDESGRWRLAPFYDLVCTRVYRRLSNNLAMSIGGLTTADNLPRSAWNAEAKSIGVTPRYLADVVSEIAAAVEASLHVVRDDLATQIGTRAPFDDVVRAIKKCVNTVKRGLAQSP